MTDKPCKCENVKQYETGVWQCMICRRKFLPVERIEFMGEQVPAGPAANLENMLRTDWREPRGTKK